MVESAALEMRYTSNGIQGSNPCLSANERAPRVNERREASQLLGSRQGFESRSPCALVHGRGRVGALSERSSQF